MKITVRQLKLIIKEELELSEVEDAIKPKYQGEFVGQGQTTSGRTVHKNVSWEKDGKRYYGKIAVVGKDKLVWNGKDWVTPAEFHRGKKLAPGEKESIADFMKRGGKVNKVG